MTNQPHLCKQFLPIQRSCFFVFTSQMLRPRAYLMCHMFIYTYILLYTSHVSLICTTEPPCHSYWIFPLSQYLAALDLLMGHGSPAYLGHTSHARAAPSTHTYLYCDSASSWSTMTNSPSFKMMNMIQDKGT